MPPVPPAENATRPRRRRGPSPSANGPHGDQGPGDPSPNGASGRDARGRFAPGNPGGPGNPFARRVAALRRVLLDAVTEVDIQLVARRLLQSAHAGDVAACKLLLAYVIGQPTVAIDPDTVDLQEWRLYRDHVAHTEDLTNMLATVPPQIACLLARAVLPHLGAAFSRSFLEQAGLETLPLPDEAGDGPAA